MQSYIRPLLKPRRLRAMMGIRAPRAISETRPHSVNGVNGLSRRRSDRSRHRFLLLCTSTGKTYLRHVRLRYERDVVMPDGPDDPGQFVRHRDRSLVPSPMRGDRGGPLLQPRQSVRRARGELQGDA
jgi:hypothetical protein